MIKRFAAIFILVVLLEIPIFLVKPINAAPEKMRDFQATLHYYVDAVNGSNLTGDGSLASPWQTISYALNQVTGPGVEIRVAPGLYVENLQFNGKDITLRSIDGPLVTTINGGGNGSTVNIGPQGQLIGFSIVNGRASSGAGIKVNGSNTIIENNIFDRNIQSSGGYGAAIGGNTASPMIRNNVFRNNSCDTQYLSGVVSFVNSSSPQIVNNIFENNPCHAINMTLPVGNAPFASNNMIVGNRVGIRIDARVNTSAHIYQNNIIVDNAIGMEVDFGSSPNYPTWRNNLVFNNTVDYDGIPSQTGINNNISSDPQFVNAAQGDYHVLPTSPVCEAGDSTHPKLPATDFDGDTRILGTAVDIGPDESQPYSVSIGKSVTTAGAVRPGDFLTYTLTISNLSSSSAGGIMVTDTLPSEILLVDLIQPEVGQASFNNGAVTWLSTLPRNDTQTLTFTAKLNELPHTLSIANIAFVADRTGGITATLPVTAPVAPLVVWDTSLHQVNRALAEPGDTLVYTLTLMNTGNVDAANVLVTNTLDSNVSFASASTGGVFDGTQIVWNGLTVPIEGQATLTVAATVNTPLANGITIINQAKVAPEGQSIFNLPSNDTTTTIYNPVQADFDGTPLTGISPQSVQFSNTSLNATSYLWDFGDGSISPAANPSHNYLSGGVYTVTLQASNPGGSDTLVRAAYITMYDPPQADFSALPTIGLTPFEVTFTNSSQHADSYVWDYGDGVTSTTTSASHTHTYASPGIYTVVLTASSAYGSDVQTRPNYITVYDPPIASFSGAPQTGVEPLLVSFTNSSLNANAYLWNFGDGSISYAANPSHVYLNGGRTYTVTLTAYNPAGGDTLIKTSYITVHSAAVADFAATPTVGLSPLEVTFTNSSQHADSYVWDYGDGVTSTTTSASHTHTYASPGIYTVVLTASNPHDSDTKVRTNYIAVYNTPIASFSGTPQTGRNPLEVSFTNSSINATSYSWDFGDGNFSSAANPTHTYLNGGTYTVTLTASNPASSDTLIRPAYITIQNAPIPDFLGEPTVGLSPLEVTFTNTSQHADSYIWGYGDGNSSSTTAITHAHTYSIPGTFSVTLTATNIHGTASKTETAYVHVYPVPVADFDLTPSIGPAPLSVTFTNSSRGATQYSWIFGDGNSSLAANPTHIYSATGLYTVTLTASNPAASQTFTRTVFVYDMPQADFSRSPIIGSVPLIVSFTNNSQNADTYEWRYGDGTSSTVGNAVHDHTYVTPGLYTVTLKAANIYTHHTKIMPGYVIVYPSPPPTDFYVDAINGDDTFGMGASAAPWKTISRALSLLKNPGMKIHVAPGYYDEVLGEVFPLNIPPGISMIGAGRDTTIISGRNDTSVLYIGSETTNGNVVSDLTIQNGSIGLSMHTTAQQTISPIIANTRIRWNGTGINITTGQVYQDGASVTTIISNTEVSNNNQTGIYMKSYGYFSPSNVAPTIINSTIQNNGSHGIHIDASAVSANGTTSAPQIINTKIIGNGGHGIYSRGLYQGWVKSKVERSWIDNNAGYGFYWSEGINSGNIDASLVNTIVVRNQAGGLYLGDSRGGSSNKMQVINSTFAANTNYGIYWKRGSDEVTPLVVNTILWNAWADDLYSSSSAWSTSQIQYSNIEDGDLNLLGSNISQDPLFLTNYHVVSSSPVVDAGNSSHPNLPATDIDGDPRILGAEVDMGADEADSTLDIPVEGGIVTPAEGITITTTSGVFSDTVLINFIPQPITSTGTLSNVGVFYELNATYLSNGVSAQPLPGHQYTINVMYRQEDVPPGINEADLALYYWNNSVWIKESTSVVDVNANIITAKPNHFSLWAALGEYSSSQKIYLPIVLQP